MGVCIHEDSGLCDEMRKADGFVRVFIIVFIARRI